MSLRRRKTKAGHPMAGVTNSTIVGALPKEVWRELTLEQQGIVLLLDDYCLGRHETSEVLARLRWANELRKGGDANAGT